MHVATAAGPKAVHNACVPHHPVTVRSSQCTTAPAVPPWCQPWANFVKAQRHLLNLAMIESLVDADISPMHIVQRDETLASIARVWPHSCPELVCYIHVEAGSESRPWACMDEQILSVRSAQRLVCDHASRHSSVLF